MASLACQLQGTTSEQGKKNLIDFNPIFLDAQPDFMGPIMLRVYIRTCVNVVMCIQLMNCTNSFVSQCLCIFCGMLIEQPMHRCVYVYVSVFMCACVCFFSMPVYGNQKSWKKVQCTVMCGIYQIKFIYYQCISLCITNFILDYFSCRCR